MKEEDKMYEWLITGIKSHDPVLRNPEELMADVMQRIADLPQRRTGKYRVWYLSGWISTAAATLLLCFMVNEVFFYPAPIKEKSVLSVENQMVVSPAVSSVVRDMPELSSPDLSLIEKSELLLPVLRQMQAKSKFQFFEFNYLNK